MKYLNWFPSLSLSHIERFVEEASNTDWYRCKMREDGTTLFSRREVVMIAYLAQNMIRENDTKIARSSFLSSLEEAKLLGFKSELEKQPWNILKDVIKNMKRRFEKENDHSRFENFLLLARTIWRHDQH